MNTFLAVCLSFSLFAQTNAQDVQNVKTYIAYIDSINELSYAHGSGFLHSVEDGVIRKDDAVVGGFGVYILANLRQDTVYRIEYNGGASVTVNKAYYYKSNQIIVARLTLIDKSGEFYRREEFYDKLVNFHTNLKKKRKANRFATETDISLMEDGLKYLQDFEKFNH